MKRQGRPEKINQEHVALLRQFALETPMATVDALLNRFQAHTGLTVSKVTLSKALKRAGIERIKPTEPPSLGAKNTESDAAKHYGYQARHRPAVVSSSYPSSLTDAEWSLVSDLFEQEGTRGKPPQVPRRVLVDACCYVVRTGCAWRLLPKDFPHWDNVYKTFRRWSEQGRFEAMHDRLRALWRTREARDALPTQAVLDAQSTRSSPQGGVSGYDAGKKVKGRKRNLVVDTLGLVLAVSVCAAHLQDRDAGTEAVAQATAKYPNLQRLYVDTAYAGQWAKRTELQHRIAVEVVRHPANRNVGRWQAVGQMDLFAEEFKQGFGAMPKRWIVERDRKSVV